jgi:hypothetical protein|tara:strand:- start:318 stop:878 length:561 start_codon:yes stop_codon:yes gene_type:complete
VIALETEKPIDKHLKPVKSNGVNTSFELSDIAARFNGDLEVNGSLNAPEKVGWHGSTSLIKVMPTDFMSNDDRATPYMVIEDDTSDKLGIRVAHGVVELYSFIPIPSRFKAIAVQVYASASTSSAVAVFSHDITNGDTTTLETGDFNAEISITNVQSTNVNNLVLKLTPALTSTTIYGAGITIGVV